MFALPGRPTDVSAGDLLSAAQSLRDSGEHKGK